MPTPRPPARLSVQDSVAAALREGRRSYSFEFFPPKDAAGEEVLWTSIRRLEPLAPTFVSVTYGAGGTTRDRTVRVTRQIAETTTLTPVAHLTCVAASTTEVREVVASYAAAGVRNVLALRGDPPGDPGGRFEAHPDGFVHATDLVRMVSSLGDFCVGVAAFPEGHPESPDLDHDARVLVAKAQAGAQFAVTQFFFDADDYFRLVDKVASLGCDIPVLPGLMPVTSLPQIERFARLGSSVPGPLADALRAVGDDPAAVREIGLAATTALAARLLDGGAPGLHFYTLNRSTATMQVYRALGLAAAPVGAA